MITEETMQAMEAAHKEVSESDMGWFDPHNKAIYVGLANAVPDLVAEVRRLRAVLEDFATTGIRCNLNPTLPMEEALAHCLRRIDNAVKDRAEAALGGD